MSNTSNPRPWVRATKLAATAKPICPPGDWETFIPGHVDNGLVSLPVDYSVEGFLNAPPVVGGRLFVERYLRNDIQRRGSLITTRITHIEGNRVHTRNSIYIVEFKQAPSWDDFAF